MGRFAEGVAESATEVRRRHGGRGSHVRHREFVEVAGIDEIPGPEELAGQLFSPHLPSMPSSAPLRRWASGNPPIECVQGPVAIRSRFSTDFSSIATGTTGHVKPVSISSEAFDQSQ
jgi:hypothetical protein